MKIGIDGRAANLYRGTGIGTYTYQLISNLSKIDSYNDYHLFLSDGSSLKNLRNNFHIESTYNDSNNAFWDNVRIPNSLNNCNVDIYHVPQNGVGLSTDIKCKKSITLHDIIPLKLPQTVSSRYLKIFNEDLPKILNNCEGIITVSNYSKSDIAKEFNFPKEKIYVTHLAAEEIYVPMSKNLCKKYLRETYGINNNFILYVGGLSPRKNILGLIEAFSLLDPSLRKTYNLVITGKKGISYYQYKKRTEELKISDSVIFTDFIPLKDLPIFYNGSEILVYPSFYEGFGLPPLEAMACGTPVIASNVTSLPEICNDAAILINPYDIYELRDAIENVLLDKKLMLTMMQKSLVNSMEYSWNNTALKTIDAFNDMVK